MTQYEVKQICKVIGMLYALEFAVDEGIANALSEAKDILEELLEGEQEICKMN